MIHESPEPGSGLLPVVLVVAAPPGRPARCGPGGRGRTDAPFFLRIALVTTAIGGMLSRDDVIVVFDPQSPGKAFLRDLFSD